MTALLPGEVGWIGQNHPPLFDPERRGPLDWTARHVPAVLRVLGADTTVGVPHLSEHDAYAAVRALTHPDVKARVHRIRVPPDGRDSTWTLATWLRCVEPADRWWRSRFSWRAPKEFPGWRLVEEGLPHLEPYEIANLRLPEDVVMDADVVLLQAWCQGLGGGGSGGNNHLQKLVERMTVWAPANGCLRDGLRKLHASPWVRFAIAAPHMTPNGILLGEHGMMASAVRVEALLRHPYSATTGELRAILGSASYRTGYANAALARKKGQYTNPPGGWYALGERAALGQWFRRGNEWTAKTRSAR